MLKKIKCFLVFICCCVVSNAQQVVSSGGYTEQSEISVDWILGGSLSDIPAYDLQAEQLMDSEISLKVYPTPATDFINIEISSVDTGRLILELYDNSGVKILNQVIYNQPFLQVNISDIPCGFYYLKIFLPGNGQPFIVEKITKI
jgi:hypothetical protein